MKGDIDDLMKQARQVQQQMEQARKKLDDSEWEGQAGAGMVRVTMTGCHDVRRVRIDPMLLSEDKTVLEDMLAAAVNDAVKKVEANSKQTLAGLASGFKLPFQI